MDGCCHTFKTSGRLKDREILKEFGNLYSKHRKVVDFLKRKEKPQVIPLEQLGEHEVAFFENNIEEKYDYLTGMPAPKSFSLEDILTNFIVDIEKGTVTAKKLYRFQGQYFMKTREYDMKNYGKTWRAWTGMPAEPYVW